MRGLLSSRPEGSCAQAGFEEATGRDVSSLRVRRSVRLDRDLGDVELDVSIRQSKGPPSPPFRRQFVLKLNIKVGALAHSVGILGLYGLQSFGGISVLGRPAQPARADGVSRTRPRQGDQRSDKGWEEDVRASCLLPDQRPGTVIILELEPSQG